jgi:2-C-methyl-D-erythritol 2,4-cyclodiphosphate synthase
MAESDFMRPDDFPDIPPIRIGHGYDIHRLEPMPPHGAGRSFRLGGIEIEHITGPVGKTDADTLLHAITDALLGAMGMPTMGMLFGETDPRRHSLDSQVFLIEACRRVRDAGWELGNLDATVILERPKITNYRDAVRVNVARILGVSPDRVSVKAKTHEGVDSIGEGLSVEAHVSALLYQRDCRFGSSG